MVSLLGLPIAQFPNIVPPEVRITTTYVGADAQTVEQSVATPIEQQMSGVDNMNYMYSINAQRRLAAADGEFRRRHRSEHRPDPLANARDAGGAATAGGRAQLTASPCRNRSPRR